MTRGGTIARLNQLLLSGIEHRIAADSKVGTGAFIDAADFPWARELERHTSEMIGELEGVLRTIDLVPCFQDISPIQRRITSDRKWKTFVFYAYGWQFRANCVRCPITAGLLRTIPGMSTAFFSILLPGKRIPPHRGPYNGVVRLHLPLRVPADEVNCAISVGGEIRHWRVGQSLFFDDTRVHQVWNDTAEARVVLFVDVRRPTRFPTSVLNRLYIFGLSLSPLVRSAVRRGKLWDEASADRARASSTQPGAPRGQPGRSHSAAPRTGRSARLG